MLTQYIKAAMRHVRYEILLSDGFWFPLMHPIAAFQHSLLLL